MTPQVVLSWKISHPAASSRLPPTPTTRSCGSRCLIRSISGAARRSPETSPATTKSVRKGSGDPDDGDAGAIGGSQALRPIEEQGAAGLQREDGSTNLRQRLNGAQAGGRDVEALVLVGARRLGGDHTAGEPPTAPDRLVGAFGGFHGEHDAALHDDGLPQVERGDSAGEPEPRTDVLPLVGAGTAPGQRAFRHEQVTHELQRGGDRDTGTGEEIDDDLAEDGLIAALGQAIQSLAERRITFADQARPRYPSGEQHATGPFAAEDLHEADELSGAGLINCGGGKRGIMRGAL